MMESSEFGKALGVNSPSTSSASSAVPCPAKSGAAADKKASATTGPKCSAGKSNTSTKGPSKSSVAGNEERIAAIGPKSPPAGKGKQPAAKGSKHPAENQASASTKAQSAKPSSSNAQPQPQTSKIAKISAGTIKGMESDIKNVNSRLDNLESMLTRVVEALPATRPTVDETCSYIDAYDGDDHDQYDMPMDQGDPGSVIVTDESLLNEEMETLNRDTHAHESNNERDLPAFAARFAIKMAVGNEVNEDIARSTLYMLDHQLEEKTLSDTNEKYPPPNNCEYLDVPKVNSVIWDKLSQTTRSKDLKLQRVQKSLTRGISAYIQTLSRLPDVTPNEGQQDTLALLCNANFEMNALRKELIKPEMNPQCAHLCKSSNPVTKFLFGDDLSKRVKDLREEQRAASGVVKGQTRSFQRHRYQHRPYDYKAPRTQYDRAGWTPSQGNKLASGSSGRPFLGRRQWGQKRPPPPATQSRPPPTQHKPPPSQRK